MAKKKSFAAWLGEMWELFSLGKELSTERDLQAAEAWNNAAPERRQDFVDFVNNIGNVLFAGHTEEREIKKALADATAEDVTDTINNFNEDFNSGQESVRSQAPEAETKAAVKQYTDTGSIEGLKALGGIAEDSYNVSALEIQSQMGKAFDEDKTIQDTIKAPEVTNQDILKRTPIGGLSGPLLEQYLQMVAEGEYSPEDAYKSITGRDLASFVTDDDGKIQFEEVTNKEGKKLFIPIPVQVQPESLFMNGFVNHIRRQNPGAIEELKRFLVLNGIADEDDFDDSGEMDPALEGIINTLMTNANYKYSHLTYGSHEWNELVDSVPRNFGWVLESDMDREKASWALLGKAIIDYKDDMAFVEKGDLKAKAKEYEANMDVPHVGEMSFRINNFFEDALGRPPTTEERNRFLNEWNTGYDTYVQKNIAAYKAAEYGADMERYLIENGESITAEEEEALKSDIQAGGDVLTGIVGEREVETDFVDDEDIFYNTYWNMTQYTDKVQAGKDKREHQSNLMKLITGKI